MRALLFGTYERDYPRNAQVAACLRRAGVEVVERHVPVWEGRRHKFAAGAGAALRLARAQAALLARRPPEPFDVVLVGYPGHLDLTAARRAARGRPVVFCPLVTLTDTLVEDRGRFAPGSLAARALRRLDRHALRAADLVVADTEANASYLRGLAGLPEERVVVCLVGAEERLFQPGPHPPAGAFHALFVGKLIPLHGLPAILAAARLAPEVPFRLVGSGQLEGLLCDLPPNIEHVPWVEYERLPEELRAAGCALGIFGTSAKAARVIPNKVFQALACGVPVVTADTHGARELLDGESAVLVPPGDPEALAAAVRRLAAEPELAARIGAAGLAAYRAAASEDVLGRRWRALLEGLAGT